MQLVRNSSEDGRGKYEVSRTDGRPMVDAAQGGQDEFFVLMLKDRHAQAALRAYAESVRATDPEYAAEVDELASRAGPDSPFCKDPD